MFRKGFIFTFFVNLAYLLTLIILKFVLTYSKKKHTSLEYKCHVLLDAPILIWDIQVQIGMLSEIHHHQTIRTHYI